MRLVTGFYAPQALLDELGAAIADEQRGSPFKISRSSVLRYAIRQFLDARRADRQTELTP